MRYWAIGRVGLAAALLCVSLGATPQASLAQETRNNPKPTLREFGDNLARYYERPIGVVRIMSDWEELGAPGRDSMMGFLAGLFVKHPDEIKRATAATNFGRMAQAAVIQGLRLADRYPEALGVAAGWGWPQNQIAPITPVRPLRQLAVEHPAAFDVLWAASFATGDAAYVRPIYDYYDKVASEPGVDVRDIVAIVILKFRPNKDSLEAIKNKYPEEKFVRVVYASSALWSLESNSRQHKFVAAALDRYGREKPKSSATEGLTEVRKAVGITFGVK